MPERSCSSSDGFSLVETLVAMAVVTVGVVSLVALALQTTDVVSRSRARIAGLWLADARVSQLVERPPVSTSPTCLVRDVPGCVEYLDSSGRPTTAATFVRRWRVVSVPTASSPMWSVAACVVAPGIPATGGIPGVCVQRLVYATWP